MKETGKSKTRHEGRARVVFNLPLNGPHQEEVVFDVIHYLKQQIEKPHGVSGFTHSDLMPSVFRGWWWDEEGGEGGEGEWVEDELVLFFVDYLTSSGGEQVPISGEITALKQVILDSYRQHDSEQDEVWIVAQRVNRYA